MKTTSLKILTIAAVAACLQIVTAISSYGQSMYPWCNGKGGIAPKNSGREFLLVYMDNQGEPDEIYQDIYVASLGDSAVVTISCRAYQFSSLDSTIVKLAPNQGMSVPISGLHLSHRYLVTGSESIDDHTIHVVSTAPIVCYGMNHKRFSADAFLALPKEVVALGSEYRILSFANSNNPDIVSSESDKKSSEFAVAAFEDNTQVTITPKAITAGGSLNDQPITFTLNALQCVLIQAATNQTPGDLTGSVVSVAGGKPVAVYGGHVRTEIPYRFEKDSGGTSRDHLAEAIPPTETWGNKFIVANTNTAPNGDLMRVLSDENGNVVKINGNAWCTLNAGEFKDTMIDFTGNPVDYIFAVDASKRSLVGLYCHTAASNDANRDPFLAIVPPVNQTYNDYTYFLSSDSTTYVSNFLLIATEASGAGKITLTPPSGPQTTPPSQSYIPNQTPLQVGANNQKYSVAWLPQNPPGIWRIQSTNPPDKGFIILAYGFGKVDSYGYTAGALFKPLSATSVSHDARSPYPGTPELPVFKLHNIMGVPIYFDSMVMSYTSNPENIPVYGLNMRPKALGQLDAAETKTITFTPERPSNDPITGKATIYYHSGLYSDLRPQEIDFRIETGAMASVASNTTSTDVTLYPNPVHGGSTALAFNLPSSAQVTLKVYDQLGRLISTVVDGRLTQGEQTLYIPVRTLENGAYVYDLSVPSLGISKRGEFVVAQ
ncbi:MAG TPA: T9SS type A sorting domain-containing protein [Candidatus Kapabacteria bacterium]|nr:T9SS type A sorting domain-containing protein [Candidatus Kapabacteria bacterium]